MSSSASDVTTVLASRPLSAKQIRERREAESPRTKQIATSGGQVVEPPATSTEAPRVVKYIKLLTTD